MGVRRLSKLRADCAGTAGADYQTRGMGGRVEVGRALPA